MTSGLRAPNPQAARTAGSASAPRTAGSIVRDNGTLLPFLLVSSGATSAFQLVMARQLAPADYAEAYAVLGALSLLVTPAQVVQTLVARRAAALAAAGRIDALRQTARAAVGRVGLAALAAALLIAAGAPVIQSILQLDSPWPVAAAGAAAGVLIFEPVARGLVQGARDFVGLGASLAAHGLGRLIVGAAAVFAGGGPTGALLASPASALGGIAVGWLFALRILRRPSRGQRPVPRLSGVSDHARVAVILFALAGLLHLDVLAVKAVFPAQTAAQYAALALVGRIVFWGGTAVGAVLLPSVVWRAATGAGVMRAYLASLALMAAIAGGAALVILGWPDVVYGLIFGGRYPPYTELLPLYAAAAGLLAAAAVTANLHVGAGRLRVWLGLAVILAATAAGYALHNDTPRAILTVLLVGTAAAAAYLAAEALALARGSGAQLAAHAA